VIAERSKGNINVQDSSKVFMTDQQLMWEHIIEMNKEIERLRGKNKKRKQQFNELVNDMYYVDGDSDTNQTSEEQNVEENVEDIQPQHSEQTRGPEEPRNRASNWRSRIKYLP
jgi:hypothetical protein